jgi:hypothetical protein
MTSSPGPALIPISVSIDNLDDWADIKKQIQAETGVPPAATTDDLVGLIGSAVPLLFEADLTHNADQLRGTFSDQVVAQCRRNAGGFYGDRPTSVVVHLVGAPKVGTQPVLRAHIQVKTATTDGSVGANNQFWDFELGGESTVGQSNCPTCGAPLGKGELICNHCNTDVRSVVHVPLAVSRLELY